MSNTAFLFSAPNGVPGDVSRPDGSKVEPIMLVAVANVFAQSFGIPLAYVSGGASQWQTGNVATDFRGVLSRSVPSISLSLDQTFTAAVPNHEVPQGILVQGYINVLCKIGTPARGGLVYIRTVADTGKAIGDFEAVSDPGNNVVLTLAQAQWAVDGKDADNNTEMRVAII